MDGRSNGDVIALRWLIGDDVPGINHHENTRDVYDFTLPVLRGEMRLKMDGRVFHDGEVRPGMLRVLCPGERVAIFRQTRAKAAVLSIAGPYLRRIVAESATGRRVEQLSGKMLAVDARMAQLCSLVSSASDIDPRHRQLFLQGLSAAVLAITFGSDSSPAILQRRGMTDAEFGRCVELADARIGDRLDLESWATVVGMPPPEFARKFRRYTGISPYAWLLNRRIERAKQLLTAPTCRIAVLALEVGFSSQSHFTDAFKRRVGVSPGVWRRTRSRTP